MLAVNCQSFIKAFEVSIEWRLVTLSVRAQQGPNAGSLVIDETARRSD